MSSGAFPFGEWRNEKILAVQVRLFGYLGRWIKKIERLCKVKEKGLRPSSLPSARRRSRPCTLDSSGIWVVELERLWGCSSRPSVRRQSRPCRLDSSGIWVVGLERAGGCVKVKNKLSVCPSVRPCVVSLCRLAGCARRSRRLFCVAACLAGKRVLRRGVLYVCYSILSSRFVASSGVLDRRRNKKSPGKRKRETSCACQY